MRYAQLAAIGIVGGLILGYTVARMTAFSQILALIAVALLVPPLIAGMAGAAVARTYPGALLFAAYTDCIIVTAMGLTVYGPLCLHARFDTACLEPVAVLAGYYSIAPFVIIGVPTTLIAWPLVAKPRAFRNSTDDPPPRKALR